MNPIVAWLIAIIEKTGLEWLWGKISSYFKSAQDISATHQSDIDQANQDMKKIENLPPDATAEQEADAGSDVLKHL